MKKISALFLTLCILMSAVCSLPAYAVEYTGKDFFTKDKIEYRKEPNGTLTALTYNGSQKELTIPTKVKGMKVTRISFGFLDSSKTETVKLSAIVRKIDGSSFRSGYLKAIEVDKNNPKYSSADGVLYNKSGTTLVCFPSRKAKGTYSVRKGVKKIGKNAFTGARITGVKLPSSVTEIGNGAFDSCAFKSVAIPNSVKKLGKDAFMFCQSLSSVKLGKNIKELGEGTFCWTNLKSIKLPKKLKSLGKDALSSTPLKEIDIPASVKSIGDGCFRFCEELRKVVLHKGLETIGKGSFEFCGKLGSVKLPSTLKSIGEGAFSDAGITEIRLPKALKTLGKEALSSETGSSKLKKITVAAGNKYFASKDGVLFDKRLKKLLLYPAKTPRRSYTVPNTVSTIEVKAFGSAQIEKLTIPESVKRIKESAFEYAEVDKFEIRNGLETIDPYAFTYCNTPELKLPDSVRKIGSHAFYAGSMMRINVPDGLEEIAGTAYFGTFIFEITVPKSVKKIGKAAFGFLTGECGTVGDPVPGFTVKGYKGTAAEKYAKKNGFKFVELG